MLIEIRPTELVKKYLVQKIDVTISDLRLNESVTLNVLMLDNNGQLIEVKNIELSGDEYKGWSDDDTYIVSKVCKYLDLSPL